MDEATLSLIQQKIGYQFVNPVLLKQAFVSPSLSDAMQNRLQNYQVLEFIGDAVLGLAVVKNLLQNFVMLILAVSLFLRQRKANFRKRNLV